MADSGRFIFESALFRHGSAEIEKKKKGTQKANRVPFQFGANSVRSTMWNLESLIQPEEDYVTATVRTLIASVDKC